MKAKYSLGCCATSVCSVACCANYIHFFACRKKSKYSLVPNYSMFSTSTKSLKTRVARGRTEDGKKFHFWKIKKKYFNENTKYQLCSELQ